MHFKTFERVYLKNILNSLHKEHNTKQEKRNTKHIVSLLSYEGHRLQKLGHLYRKTHNKKTKTNQNCKLLKIKNIV